ncbi:MAG: glycoside hydrolase family 97 catalytic domain-containing protein [Bacteroidales bacterium]|nr:glycoside hydrolase family 97 catalytic domain-containing protein [Bacteroidales bacterium]
MKHLLALLALSCLSICATAKTFSLLSPNGRLAATISNTPTATTLALSHGGTAVLSASPLSMTVGGKALAAEQCKKAKPGKAEQCNTLTLQFSKYSVEFRAYDGGVAYRFVTAMPDSITIDAEQVELHLLADCMAYQAPANSHHKTADLRDQAYCSFENTYVHKRISELDHGHLGLSPMLVELEGGKKLLIGDYNVRSYPGMFLLAAEGAVLKGFFPPYPKHEYQGDHNNLQMIVDDWHPYIARTAGARTFPWKMMLVSEQDADLINTTIPRLLADAPVVDASWAKPGKVAWDWWNDWNITGVDFAAGINNATYKHYIDFAARHGVEYVILDEGWAVNKKADLMQVVPEIDLPMLVNYARERGVGIVLWAGYKAFERDMERVCQHYSAMGVKGFKIDFMDRCDQKMMAFLERAAATCAKYCLFCDFHGTPVPNGMTITYPNVLNYEAVAGQEQVKWSKFSKYDQVRHETLLPFIRQVVGPMDYTQGAMRNATKKSYHPCYSQPMSQGTRCRQLALYVVFDSPFNMLCDTPTNYEANPECLDFIAQIPVVWDERRVLAAKVGEYVIEACRKGDRWWVGGITNWKARSLSLDLDFIAGREMQLFTDGLNAARHAEDFKITTGTVPTTLTVNLAPGGGFVLQVK